MHLLLLGGRVHQGPEHASKVLDLYDTETHRHLADILNQDPKTVAGVVGSISTWILGYPDRALRLNNEKDAHARQRGQLFDLGWALTIGAHEFDHRFTQADLRKRAEECERLGRENSLPVLWAQRAPIVYGMALIREGRPAEGIAPIKAGIAFFEANGGKVRMPVQKAFLAEAMALAGDLDNALAPDRRDHRPNRTPRMGGTPFIRRGPTPQGLDALAQGRP